jgi:N-acetylmuramoyl-L-alanine amidase
MKRRTLIKGAGLLLTFGFPRLIFAASVLKVRIWPAPEYSRITIESDSHLSIIHKLLTNPTRLEISLKGVPLSSDLREIADKVLTSDPNIAAIQVSQKGSGDVTLDIILKHEVVPNIFSLNPVGPYQDRLVIDLYPKNTVDTLDNFIAQLRQDKTLIPETITQNSSDPLGELIAKAVDKNRHTNTVPEVEKKIKPVPVSSERVAEATIRPSRNSPKLARSTPQQKALERLIIIAIDPGHGGEDPGAIGPGGTREKDVVLRLGGMLRERINDSSANGNPMRTFLTRDDDYFVPLYTRVQKAMRVQADLFVSVHADAFTTSRPQGASVYALSQHGATSATARWLAKTENHADVIGGVDIKTSDRFLRKTILDMSTTAQIKDSMKLGGHIIKEVGHVARLHKNYVEQAGFAVLKSPSIPSVLVESAFISNPEDEEKLNDKHFLETLADALTQGIVDYFNANPSIARKKSLLRNEQNT